MSGLISNKKIKKYLIAAAATVCISAAVLLCSTLTVLSLRDPDRFVRPFSYAALYVSSLISGIVSIRVTEGTIPTVTLFGTAMTLLLTLADVLLFHPATDLGTSLLLHAALIGSFAAGGALGKKNFSYSRRSRKRRRVRR